jgi:hypothetical protein
MNKHTDTTKVIFETGATSAAVNELILYTDSTEQLAALRDEFYIDELPGYFNPNARKKSLVNALVTLCHTAITRYTNEMGYVNSKHIRDLTSDQISEYCQIYANRFPEWKKERERNPQ